MANARDVHFFDYDGTCSELDGRNTISSDLYNSLYRYKICEMKDDLKPEGGNLYIREKNGNVAYSVITPSGEFVKDIPTTIPFAVYNFESIEDANLMALEDHRPLFEITTANNHTTSSMLADSSDYWSSPFHNEETVDRLLKDGEKIERNKSLYPQKAVITYIKLLLELGEEVVFVTKNRNEYLRAQLLHSDLTKEQLAKITIYDVKTFGNVYDFNKEKCVQQHIMAMKQKLGHVSIYDDSEGDFNAMIKGLKGAYPDIPDAKIGRYNLPIGEFNWDQKLKEKLDNIINSVNELEQTGQATPHDIKKRKIAFKYLVESVNELEREGKATPEDLQKRFLATIDNKVEAIRDILGGFLLDPQKKNNVIDYIKKFLKTNRYDPIFTNSLDAITSNANIPSVAVIQQNLKNLGLSDKVVGIKNGLESMASYLHGELLLAPDSKYESPPTNKIGKPSPTGSIKSPAAASFFNRSKASDLKGRSASKQKPARERKFTSGR